MHTQTDTQLSVPNLPRAAGSVSTQHSVLDYKHITGSVQTGTTQQSDTKSSVGKLTELIGIMCHFAVTQNQIMASLNKTSGNHGYNDIPQPIQPCSASQQPLFDATWNSNLLQAQPNYINSTSTQHEPATTPILKAAPPDTPPIMLQLDMSKTTLATRHNISDKTVSLAIQGRCVDLEEFLKNAASYFDNNNLCNLKTFVLPAGSVQYKQKS